MNKRKRSRPAKPPIRWVGVLFAAALNLALVSLAQLLVNRLGLSFNYELLATLIAPVLAGILTHFYVQERTGVHAVLGGLISIPLLAYLSFDGVWQFAILAGAFCGLSGAVAELLTRPRRR